MNRLTKVLIVCCSIIWSFNNIFANEIEAVEVQINTVDKSEIHFVIRFTEEIDRTAAVARYIKEKYSFTVRKASDGSIIYNSKHGDLGFGRKKINLIVSNLDKNLINLIHKKEIPIFIEIKDDITIDMPNDLPPFVLTKSQVKKLSEQAFNLSDEQRKMLAEAAGGEQFLLTNHFDLSKQVNESDSAEVEYVANFEFVRKFGINLGKSNPLLLRFKGVVSTNKDNPINKTEFYAVFQIPLPKVLYLELGRAGKQDFSTNIFTVNFYVQGLIPNLIDLTHGAARLRLKPYLKGGLRFTRNFQIANPYQNKKLNPGLFAEGYYYIPVAKKFALIVEAEAFYSDNFKSGNKFRVFYNLSFSYDLPLKDLKVLFKVQGGENDVNIGDDTRALIGILMDFIPF